MSDIVDEGLTMAHARQKDDDNQAARMLVNLSAEIKRLRKENEGYRSEYLEVKKLLNAAHDKPCGEYWRDYHVMPLTRRLKEAQEDAVQAREEALEEAEQIANEHSLQCEDDGIRVALAIRQDIRALKDTTREGAD